MWQYVTWHFSQFQKVLELTDDKHKDAQGKAWRIGECLHRSYYEGEYKLGNVFLSGSYGKNTAIQPTSDIDLLYFLPLSAYFRFNAYNGNGQSSLLQEVKGVLSQTYSRTDMKADGQVIVVDYDSYKFEVVPAFVFGNQIITCDTNNGGRWKIVDPFSEFNELDSVDKLSMGSARALIKYLKAWKRRYDVPLKSIILEVAACSFLKQWYYLELSIRYGNPYYWHDWMVRDFFAYLLNFDRAYLPGTGELVYFGDGWKLKTQSANEQAIQACIYEQADLPLKAEGYWTNIFGSSYPSVKPKPAYSSLLGQLPVSGRRTLLGGF